MNTITPCLWFDDQGEEAAEFYTSIFPNSRIVEIGRYTDTGPGEPGSVMVVAFELDGRPFTALNGGPLFTFSEAVSLQVPCGSQEEVDHYWDALVEGGEPSQCGWLKDRFGFSWQVFPTRLLELIKSPDRAQAARVNAAMMQMQKIDLAEIERVAATTADAPA